MDLKNSKANYAIKKATTLRRMSSKAKKSTENDTDFQKSEDVRAKSVKKQTEMYDKLSSNMNACQALVKPDCSKPQVNKASTIKTAFVSLVSECVQNETKPDKTEELLASEGLAYLDEDKTHRHSKLLSSCQVAVIEMSGLKFKTTAKSGNEYMKQIQEYLIDRNFRIFPCLENIILIEEKYTFTPDHFKAATKQQRNDTKKKSNKKIGHLKEQSEIVNENYLDKNAISKTELGKRAMTTYPASKLSEIKVPAGTSLIVDSEFVMVEKCVCSKELSNTECTCSKYAVPLCLRCSSDDICEAVQLNEIQQRKGEAEMAMADWVVEMSGSMKEGCSLISIVTSGDIDALIIHLYVIGRLWPRRKDGTFQNTVFLMLEKPHNKQDIYNITALVTLLESRFGEQASLKIASLLTFGGNDYIPKFSGFGHKKVLDAILEHDLIDSMFTCKDGKFEVNKDIYIRLVKYLYCPKVFNADLLSLEQVRQYSIKKPNMPISEPQKWMPPEASLERLIQLINLQMEYLHSAGKHSSHLPNFLHYECLSKDKAGEVRYDFGPASSVSDVQDLLTIDEQELSASFASAKVSLKRSSNNPVQNSDKATKTKKKKQ